MTMVSVKFMHNETVISLYVYCFTKELRVMIISKIIEYSTLFSLKIYFMFFYLLILTNAKCLNISDLRKYLENNLRNKLF